MKFNTSTIIMLIAILGSTPLCYAQTSADKTSIEKVKQESQDLLETLKVYSVEQKDEAVRKTKIALDDLDERIDAMEADVDKSWNKMDKSAREKARNSLKVLRKQRNQVSEWYGSMKSSSEKTWGHMKKGFSNAYKELNDSWEKSETEFDSSN